jgi:hypothetical protein
MGIEPIANSLSPVESVGLKLLEDLIWAQKRGILRSSCAQIYPSPIATRQKKGAVSLLLSEQQSILLAWADFQLNRLRDGVDVRVVVFVDTRLKRSGTDGILCPQPKTECDSVARSKRIEVQNGLRRGQTELL